MLGFRRRTYPGPGAPATGSPSRRRGRPDIHDPDATARPARGPRCSGRRRHPRRPRDGRFRCRPGHPPRHGRRAVLLRARQQGGRPRPRRRRAAGGRRRPVRGAPARAGRSAAAGRLGPRGARAAGGRLLRPPLQAHGPGRGDRHQRQDHDRLHARGGLPGGRAGPGAGRHRRGARRRPSPAGRPHHPGGSRPAAPAGRDGRLRCAGCRHGGLQPRPGAGAGRRHPLPRRRLHQPHPGPPGLPPRPGGLLPGQAPPAHARVHPGRGGQPRRSLRPPPGQRGGRDRACHDGRLQRRRLARQRGRGRAGRL